MRCFNRSTPLHASDDIRTRQPVGPPCRVSRAQHVSGVAQAVRAPRSGLLTGNCFGREDNPMSAKIKGAHRGGDIRIRFRGTGPRGSHQPLPERACSAVQTACLPWQAPIGHRQPGAAELPANFTLPPLDLELRALDRALDKKPTICRGC
jgi:hypothetical protein